MITGFVAVIHVVEPGETFGSAGNGAAWMAGTSAALTKVFLEGFERSFCLQQSRGAAAGFGVTLGLVGLTEARLFFGSRMVPDLLFEAVGLRLSRPAVVLCLLISILVSPSRAQSGLAPLEITTASGPHSFQVEIANNEASREKGLMFRRFMPADRGMLFEFERNEPVAFWMKNTYIPLDMVFIARDGVVTHVAANAEPLSEAIVPSGGPCVAVLELNGGEAAKIGLREGDKVRAAFFKP